MRVFCKPAKAARVRSPDKTGNGCRPFAQVVMSNQWSSSCLGTGRAMLKGKESFLGP
jgi:hypothetical protein